MHYNCVTQTVKPFCIHVCTHMKADGMPWILMESCSAKNVKVLNTL